MVDSAGGYSSKTGFQKVQKQLFQMLETEWCQNLKGLKVRTSR